MGLDMSKVENVRSQQGGITTARCPACAEEGHDHKANHLFIGQDGRYGCVRYPGKSGQSIIHRKRIFEIVGIREDRKPVYIKVREIKRIESLKVIESNILGRLGLYKLSQEKIENIKEAKIASKDAAAATKSEGDIEIDVPIVPNNCSYTIEELHLIKLEDEDILRFIHYAKTIFPGATVVSPESTNSGKERGSLNTITKGGEIVMDTSGLSLYVVPDVDVVTGDVVTFLTGGNTKKFEDGNPRLQLDVELPSGSKKIITINSTSLKQLQGKYGYESNDWVGKQAKVTIMQQSVRGSMKKVIFLSPV